MSTTNPRPPSVYAGLALPGLGHVLTGAPLAGIVLMGTVALLLASAYAGMPRLPAILGLDAPKLHVHGTLAAVSWCLGMITCWSFAWRRIAVAPSSTLDHATLAVFLRAFQRNRTGMLGLAGVVWLLTLTILAPLIAPYDPTLVEFDAVLPPSWTHPMGTDELGRDLASRVLFGARVSMSIGFIAVGIAATLGTLVGAIAGFYGGWVDRVAMWFVDLLMSVPRLVLLLAIIGLFRPKEAIGIFLIVTVLGFTGWTGVGRIVRSQVLSLKEQEFIQAARALGLASPRIVLRHLIPNAFAPVIVYCSLAIGSTMLAEASLSFLGLGVQEPVPTWGSIIATGRNALTHAPWISTFPGLFIVAAVMSFNLLGDGLRDALDPKQRGHG